MSVVGAFLGWTKTAGVSVTTTDMPEDGAAEPAQPPQPTQPGVLDAGTMSGHLRRARRAAGHSQRRLAELLGVSGSTVGRWETGDAVPAVDDLLAVLEVAGLRLVVVDGEGAPVVPMREDALRDRAGRRYPAHFDPRGEGWWTPPGSLTGPGGGAAWLASRDAGVPRVTWDRGVWRAVMRAAYGMPVDHPTRTEVLEAMRRTAETPPDPATAPD